MQRALAVDGHSMFYAQQKVGWFFDPRKLLELAGEGEGVELGSAFWYAGLRDPTDQRPFRDALTSLGFTVRTRPLRELSGAGGSGTGAADQRGERRRGGTTPAPISMWRSRSICWWWPIAPRRCGC
ncbi:MAG: NYN domain-containing protein [Cyanobacteriota bacterium]|jgi:uncharacterized LabA/DUF88 family protein